MGRKTASQKKEGEKIKGSLWQGTFETGEIQPITQDDLKKALKGRKATTLEWFATAKNYATFSDVNRDYQAVLDYMKRNGIR